MVLQCVKYWCNPCSCFFLRQGEKLKANLRNVSNIKQRLSEASSRCDTLLEDAARSAEQVEIEGAPVVWWMQQFRAALQLLMGSLYNTGTAAAWQDPVDELVDVATAAHDGSAKHAPFHAAPPQVGSDWKPDVEGGLDDCQPARTTMPSIKGQWSGVKAPLGYHRMPAMNRQ